MILKFKSKLNLKFMLKGSKALNIMKRSKNRRGLTQVKAIWVPFAYKETRNIDELWQQGNPSCKILCLTVWYVLSIVLNIEILNASYDRSNVKSIGKEHLNVFRTEWFIEKTIFFVSVEEVQKEPPEVLFKKTVLINSTVFTGKHRCWSFFLHVLEFLQLYWKKTPTHIVCIRISATPSKPPFFYKHPW